MKKAIVILAMLNSIVIYAQKLERVKSISSISVVGVAENISKGAIVVTDDKKVYFIWKVPYWDNAILGKKIKVTGKYRVNRYEVREDTVSKFPSKRAPGNYVNKYIINAKWELIVP